MHNNEDAKFKYVCSAICFAIFIGFTFIVKYVSVEAIGPDGNSSVGLAGINYIVKEYIGYNTFWYTLSHALTICGVVMGMVLGVLAFKDLLKLKSFKKLDLRYYLLGGTYALLGIIYVLFNHIIINYGPVLDEEMLYASYPSSHCLLAIVTFVTAAHVPELFRKSERQGKISVFELKLMAVLSVIARILSGRHWITDIIGSVILSFAIIFLFDGILETMPSQKNKPVPEQE